ncbi:hypothetical protein D9M71_693390 [compost metagenome]
MLDRATLPATIGRICAPGLSPARTACRAWYCASSTRSRLLTRITLAYSTCSISRSASGRLLSSVATSARATVSGESSMAMNWLASTTVTSVSSRASSLRLKPLASRKAKVSATGIGSEIPVDSISR